MRKYSFPLLSIFTYFFTSLLTIITGATFILQHVSALEQQPTLECLTDGLRLHFHPEKPFYGHIYVKGFFMSRICHLDYTRNPLYSPFYFHVSYRSSCNVQREKQKKPPGINYHVIVVVQHHYLFLTQADKAYSANCFYQESFGNLVQNMEISGLTPTGLTSGLLINCAYDVLKNSIDGEAVKYANIGDQLIHKWSCASEEYGMLVHSCLVHEPGGTTFKLINDRGCITDHTLMQPLVYNEKLTVAYSTVPAFKFTNQPNIQFYCKVTLCSKHKNGCEGITPPNCKTIPVSSIETVPDISEVQPSAMVPEIDELFGQTAGHMFISSLAPNINEFEQGTIDNGNSSGKVIEPSGYTISDENNPKSNHSENIADISTITDVTAVPDHEQIGYKRKRSFNRSNHTPYDLQLPKYSKQMAKSNNNYLLTLDVNANQLTVLERDGMSQGVVRMACRVPRNGILLQTAIFILLFALLLGVIFIQKIHYNKHLNKCDTISD
ncbi:unnamed protein product [Thelazia callipaeda]|uniref:ZP domain-containing protein n=1 Tax=Thelazia callipaeda TaxID=103827 RepID=A0A0N5D2Q4_THECL|nr:unnamed protein product [Thelazia callipaeda]